ncbi:MAG: flippase [Ignavibacteriaceae bacterium]|jgi:O-antigen/teichoic acid export membrane protein
MSSIKELSKDTIIYGLGTVIKKIIGFLLLPFYTRALIPAEYGVLDTLATLTFFISAIFSLGLGGATSRYFFIAVDEDEKKKLLYTSATIRLISYSIPLIFMTIFSEKISFILFKTESYSLVIIAVAFVIFFSSQQEIQSQIFRFYREPVKFSFVTILGSIINPFCGILLVVILKWGVLGATIASLITSVSTLSFAYLYFTRKKYIRQFSWNWAKKLLKFGYPLIFTGMLVWVNDVSDRFFLLHYKNLAQIGLYSIGNTFSQPILLVNIALNMSATVIIFSLYNEEKEEDKPRTKAFLTKIWYFYLTIAISASSFISIFSYDIVKFVTSPKYIGGILAIPFLLFSLILNQCVSITGNGMTLKEKSKPYFWLMLLAAGVNVLLNFYFIPNFGYVGAAITTIISNMVYFILAYVWSQKVFYIKRSFMRPALYFIVCLMVAVFFPFYELKGNMHVSILIKAPIFLTLLAFPLILRIIDYKLALNLLNIYKNK